MLCDEPSKITAFAAVVDAEMLMNVALIIVEELEAG